MKSSTETEIVVPELEELISDFNPRNKPWTPEEIAILKKYYLKINTKKLCDYLGRGRDSVYNKAQALGLGR